MSLVRVSGEPNEKIQAKYLKSCFLCSQEVCVCLQRNICVSLYGMVCSDAVGKFKIARMRLKNGIFFQEFASCCSPLPKMLANFFRIFNISLHSLHF